jgi:hypothetical protein
MHSNAHRQSAKEIACCCQVTHAVNGMLDPAARDMAIMGATIERIARGEVIRKNKNAGLITQAGVCYFTRTAAAVPG